MRYLGNKTKLLNKIEDLINERNINGKVFCDIFSGTGSVANHFKNKFKIISNDTLYSSFVIQNSLLLNNSNPTFKKLFNVLKIHPLDYLNSISPGEVTSKDFISKNYSYNSSDRMYFSEDNGKLIDIFRTKIEEWSSLNLINDGEYFYLLHVLIESVTKVSNTTGTYGAYLKTWDSRALKKIKLLPIEIKKSNIKNHECYNEDSNSLLREINGDILYIDPPYTNFNYESGYHVLETISKYDIPKIKGITGQRVRTHKSNFSKKNEALYYFEDIIRSANFKDIIISYSTHGIIDIQTMKNICEKYKIPNTDIYIKYINYRAYKTINKPKKNDLFEILIHFKKNIEIVKSPLNYEGNKFSIMNNLKKHIPIAIKNIHDVFGGSFTFSPNIKTSNTLYYNDINYNSEGIIKLLINSEPKNLIKSIDQIISLFNLEKGNKLSFIEYRKYVNNIIKNNDKNKYLYIYVLSLFSFQNQIRINFKGEINIPFGSGNFNKEIKKRIINFYNINQSLKTEFTNLNFDDYFRKTKFNKNDFVYCDPPYIITTATYNDGKRGFSGWNQNHEVLLLNWLNKLDDLGVNFMLSNVLVHKDNINHQLVEWIETHNFFKKEIPNNKRKEIIITNYEIKN